MFCMPRQDNSLLSSRFWDPIKRLRRRLANQLPVTKPFAHCFSNSSLSCMQAIVLHLLATMEFQLQLP